MTRTLSRVGRLAVLVSLVAVLGPHSIAQDPPASAATPGDPAATEPGRSGAGTDRQLETFEPTEKVPADSAVAFPVDI